MTVQNIDSTDFSHSDIVTLNSIFFLTMVSALEKNHVVPIKDVIHLLSEQILGHEDEAWSRLIHVFIRILSQQI